MATPPRISGRPGGEAWVSMPQPGAGSRADGLHAARRPSNTASSVTPEAVRGARAPAHSRSRPVPGVCASVDSATGTRPRGHLEAAPRAGRARPRACAARPSTPRWPTPRLGIASIARLVVAARVALGPRGAGAPDLHEVRVGEDVVQPGAGGLPRASRSSASRPGRGGSPRLHTCSHSSRSWSTARRGRSAPSRRRSPTRARSSTLAMRSSRPGTKSASMPQAQVGVLAHELGVGVEVVERVGRPHGWSQTLGAGGKR